MQERLSATKKSTQTLTSGCRGMKIWADCSSVHELMMCIAMDLVHVRNAEPGHRARPPTCVYTPNPTIRWNANPCNPNWPRRPQRYAYDMPNTWTKQTGEDERCIGIATPPLLAAVDLLCCPRCSWWYTLYNSFGLCLRRDLWSSEGQTHEARALGHAYLAEVVVDVQYDLERISAP